MKHWGLAILIKTCICAEKSQLYRSTETSWRCPQHFGLAWGVSDDQLAQGWYFSFLLVSFGHCTTKISGLELEKGSYSKLKASSSISLLAIWAQGRWTNVDHNACTFGVCEMTVDVCNWCLGPEYYCCQREPIMQKEVLQNDNLMLGGFLDLPMDIPSSLILGDALLSVSLTS